MLHTISTLLPEDLTGAFKQIWGYVNYPYRIGNIQVSLTSFITGLAVFLGALILSKALAGLLQRRVAKNAHIDPGIQYTINRLARYIIVALGVLYGAKAAFGLDLTSLAVVFTALSVGIGFGLQYLAADIAAGFILLFERPVRVGDRISIGEDEGDVQSINLRTTILMTNNRIAIIVPNSKVTSQRLINWSYGDPRARIGIPVSVAHGSDVQVVKKILLESVKGVDNALTDPKPTVQFQSFADTGLAFKLLVWTPSPRMHKQIQSDILFRIEEEFRKNRIQGSQAVTNVQVTLPSVYADSKVGDFLGKPGDNTESATKE